MNAEKVVENYFALCRRCSMITGMWPFMRERPKWSSRITVNLLTLIAIATQIARLVMFWSLETLIEMGPFVLVGLGILIKEGNYIINEKKLRELLDMVFEDWSTVRSTEEINIMDKYARRGKLITNLYLVTCIYCHVLFSVAAAAPRTLDILFPRNKSRGLGFIYPAYYFIDEEKNYYFIWFHMFIMISIVILVFLSCDSIFMCIVQHACGQFMVSGYRFKSAIANILKSDEKEAAKLDEDIFKQVIYSIRGHQHALDYIQVIQSVHETYLCLFVGLAMIGISMTFVRLSELDKGLEFYKFAGFAIGQFIHMLFISLQGQFVINVTDDVYTSIYDGLWYYGSPTVQRLYTLALARNLFPPVLSAGGLMTLNLEAFAEILKMSVSYFTVMKSA